MSQKPSNSLLSYYQENDFNPVPIRLNSQSDWADHLAKRQNLYERHLGIPLSMFRNRSVLDIGCNSGENSLCLAHCGANLTLVEPNGQVLPQLRLLFKKFNLDEQIISLHQVDFDVFIPETCYDIVLAEGFLFTMPNREKMVQKIGNLLNPGGLAIISFNDRYGGLLEITKKMILKRMCQLEGINNIESENSFKIALRLFGDDFIQLNSSRPFAAWWKDTLVNPFIASEFLWSYKELLPLIKNAGCEFYSSSPKWETIDFFTWYKNVSDPKSRHQRILDNWMNLFPFFLTGVHTSTYPATPEIIKSVAELVAECSKYSTGQSSSMDSISYPPLLDDYLKKSDSQLLQNFNHELKELYNVARSNCQSEELLLTYSKSKCLRKLWGAPYHYLCFKKLE